MNFPQGYPLWAVRACSIEDAAAEIGLVIGWEDHTAEDDAIRYPIVATLGNHRYFPGSARDWRSGVTRSSQFGERWVDRVELYATFDDAQRRAPDLFRETGEQHDSLWPQDAQIQTPASPASVKATR
jgi:hypothetical protein